MNKLLNKVAVVTGASSGIGRAIAERLAAAGASVVVAARHMDKLQEVVRAIESRRGHAHAVACDVTQEAEVRRLMEEALQRFKGLDVLVNNAGVMAGGPIVDSELADWERVIATNLTGVYLGAREGFRIMQRNGGGTIINVASVAGKEAWAGISIYAASKFGVVGLSRALADEGTPHHIRVTALCPGAVDTPMMKGSGLGAEALIAPEDVAEAALYVATLPRNVVVKELVLDRRGAD